MHFVVSFARRPHFCFIGSLIISFAMGKAMSRIADIAIDYSR